jgi:hypothetical protein
VPLGSCAPLYFCVALVFDGIDLAVRTALLAVSRSSPCEYYSSTGTAAALCMLSKLPKLRWAIWKINAARSSWFDTCIVEERACPGLKVQDMPSGRTRMSGVEGTTHAQWTIVHVRG